MRANSLMLRTPGSLNEFDIPNTIEDTIPLVRDLGESYCWIDALCIGNVVTVTRLQSSVVDSMR